MRSMLRLAVAGSLAAIVSASERRRLGGTGSEGGEDEGFGASSWLSRAKEDTVQEENGGYTSTAYVAANKRLRSHNQLHNSAAVVATQGSNQIKITSASTGVTSTIAIDASSGANAKAMLGGAGTTVSGSSAKAVASGANIIITSESIGTGSTVTVHSSSGTRANALLGSNPTAAAGQAVNGPVAATSGTLTAQFAAQNFASPENLVLVIDGIQHTITLSTNLDTVAKAADAIHDGLIKAKTAGSWTSGTFSAKDFSTTNEDLIVVVDGVPRVITLTTNLDSAAKVKAALEPVLGVNHKF